jgi:autotransporter-associated beta strand protein
MQLKFASLVVSAFALCASGVAHAQSANFSIVSNFWRHADSSGLNGVLSNMINANQLPGTPVTSVTRANGESTWASTGGYIVHGPAAFNGSPTLGPLFTDVAAASAWNDANGRGQWTAVVNGTSRTFDTTSAWVSPASRYFAQLTAASADQYLNIVNNGLTGTFTFDLTQAWTGAGSWILSGPTSNFAGSGQINAGATSITVQINAALANDCLFQLASMSYTQLTSDVTMTQIAGTAYGNFTVPAPGAIALLGLAGLAGRRRR